MARRYKSAKHHRLITVYIRPDKYDELQHGAKQVEFSYQQTQSMMTAVAVEQHRLHRDQKTRKLLIKLS